MPKSERGFPSHKGPCAKGGQGITEVGAAARDHLVHRVNELLRCQPGILLHTLVQVLPSPYVLCCVPVHKTMQRPPGQIPCLHELAREPYTKALNGIYPQSLSDTT